MATAAAGIKYKNRTDVLLMVFDRPASVAGVFTRSKCPSAPVDFCRANLPHGSARAVVVNSGNANAFTGVKGKAATALTARSAAEAVGCEETQVYLASTGVIGEPLDATKFAGVLGDMHGQASGDFWIEAAKAVEMMPNRRSTHEMAIPTTANRFERRQFSAIRLSSSKLC